MGSMKFMASLDMRGGSAYYLDMLRSLKVLSVTPDFVSQLITTETSAAPDQEQKLVGRKVAG